MKPKLIFLFIAVLAFAMLVGCNPPPATSTSARPAATPTETRFMIAEPPFFGIKPGGTPGTTPRIITPNPTRASATPTLIPEGEKAIYVETTAPVANCQYCQPGTVDVGIAKTTIQQFDIGVNQVFVVRLGRNLFVSVSDGTNPNTEERRTVWRALAFAEGKPLQSLSSGRTYGDTSYETTEYQLPAGADKIEIQIVTGEVQPVRFSLWFQFLKK